MNNSLRSHAFAFSIALLVVASGALMANAKLSSKHADTAAISRFAIGAKTTLEKASSGFVDTFGDIPSRIASRVSAAETAMRKYPPYAAAVLSSAFARATPLELSLPRITFDTDSHAFRTDSIYALKQSPDKKTATVSDTGQTHALSLRRIGETAYALILSPKTIVRASAGAYAAVGEQAYAAIGAALAAYRTLIDYSGSRALTLGAGARDALAAAPLAAMRADIAFGESVINTAHALIRADVSAAYGIAAAAPAVARATALGIGRTGAALASAASRVPSLAAAFYLETAALPSRAAPVLAEAIFSVEYAGASRFVALTDKILEQYGSFILDTGSLAHVSAANASALVRSAYALLAAAPPALEDAYLGALGKGALALEAPKAAAVLSAAQPVLALGEKAALATYETIRGLFDSTNRLFAVILGPSPTVVLPVAKKTDRTALGNVPPPPPPPPPPPVPSSARTLVTNYPTYTTVIQGVSSEAMDRSLVDLRADILTTVAGMIQPVRTQTITNATTIQQVNMIQDLSDLIVRNGDFRGGIFDDGIRVSAISGTFSSLGGGTTTLATTTITGSISIPATGLSLGSLDGPLQSNAGAVSATTSIGVLYGGTGLSSAPAYGQILLGNASGGYTLSATSSLGITGGGGAWGTVTGTLSDQTDLQSALDAKLSLSSWFATTTAPHITTLENLINATTTNLHITSAITGAGLTSCSESSSKLLWNATTRQFSCGADAGAGGGITAFGAQFSSFQTGSSQTFATSSDTNIGLTITSGTDTHTFTPTWTGTLAVGRGGTGASSFTSSQLLYGAGTGALQSVATSSLSLGLGLTNSGTLGSLVGGTSATLSIATSSLYSGTTGQFPYFSGTDTLTATSTLFLSADGRLSAGTTTPLDFFHIAPPAAQGLLLTDSVTLTSSMRFIPSDGVNYIQSGTTTATDSKADLRFTSIFNETTWMTIQGDTGNVGIGTTSPWGKLSVTNIGTGPSFVVEDSTSPDTSPFIIDASGLIGIGTTSPYRTLSVSGSAVFSGGDILASTLTATSTITAASLSLTTALPVSSGGTGATSFTSSQLLYGAGTGALQSVATSSLSLGLGLTNSGTLGSLVGGTSATLSIATSSLYSGTTGQFPYFSGTDTLTATSTIFLSASGNVGIGKSDPIAALDTNMGTTSVTELGMIDSPFFSAGQYQNYLLYTEMISNNNPGAWQKVGMVPNTVSETDVGPYGSASTGSVLKNGSDANANVNQTVADSTLGPWTFSVYLKSTDSAQTPTVNLRIDAGTGLATTTGTPNAVTLTPYWKRYSVTQNVTNAHSYLNVFINHGTATTSAWGAQLEPSAFARPYTTALVTTNQSAVTTGARIRANNLTVNGLSILTGTGFNVNSNAMLNTGALTAAANGNIVFNSYASSVSVERLRINSNGFIGIGTTTSQWTLQVASSTGAQFALSDGSLTSNHWTFRNAGGYLYLASASPSTFATSTTALTIDTSNNIGIGTTSPYRTLSVSGSAVFSGGDILASTLTATSSITAASLSLTTALPVSSGGTGATSFTSSQLLYGAGTGALQSVATSSLSLGLGLTNSGTLGSLVGGTSATLSIATSSLYSGTTGQFPYFSGTDTLTATSTLFLSADGRLSAGTTTPLDFFHIAPPHSQGLLLTDDVTLTASLRFIPSDGVNYIQSGTTTATDSKADLRFTSIFNETTWMTIQGATGNVGIGTTSPASFSFPTASPLLDISSAPGAGVAGIVMHDRDTAQESALGTNGSLFTMSVSGHAAAANNVLSFATEETDSAYTPSERMRITSAGLIGIGTTSPYRTLSVSGSAVFSGGDILASTLTATSSITAASLSLTTALPVSSGGTGQTSFTSSQLLYGAGTGALQSVATTSVSCAGTVSCTSFDVLGSSPITISGTGGGTNVIATSTLETAGTLAYWTSTSGYPATLSSVATSSLSLGLGLTNSGTLGSLVGGTSATLSIATSSLYSGTTGQFPYFSGTDTLTATSTIFLSASGNIGIGTTSPWGRLALEQQSTDSISNPTFIIGDQGTSTPIFVICPAGNIRVGMTCSQSGNSSYGNFSAVSISSAASYLIGTSGALNGSGSVFTAGGSSTWKTVIIGNSTDAKIGVGTSSPAFLLHAASSTAPQLALSDGSLTSDHWTFRNAGGYLYLASASPSTFATSTTALTIDTSNNIGIGTTSPYRTLSVSGSAVFSGGDILASTLTATSSITAASLSLTTALPVSSGGTGATSFTSSQLLYGAGTGALQSVATSSLSLGLGLTNSGTLGSLVGGTSATLSIATSSLYSGTTGQFPYFSATDTLTATSSIFVSTSGKIGIGTTTPQWSVQIANASAPQLALSDGSLTSDHWTFRNAGGYLYLATSSPLTFATSSTPRIVIGTNGNIGIGTTTPDQPLLIDTHIGITSGESRSVRSALTYNPPSVSSAIPVALAGEASYEGVGGGSGGAHMIGVTGIASMTASGQTFPKFIGVRARADVVSGTLTEGNAVLAGSGRNSGTITTLYGVKTDVTGNTGTITDYYGFHSQGTDNSGTITSYTGLSVTMPNGTVSTSTGIKIADLTGTGAYNRGIMSSVLTGTNKHNLYIDGTAPSYFAADIGIGTTSPDTFTYPTASPLLNISSPAGTGITVLAMHDRDTTQESAFGTAGNGFVMSVAGHTTASNNFIAFQTEDTASVYTPTERMRITSAGLVGLGTTSPATLLEVGGSTNNITFDGYKNCTGYTSNGNGLLACTASDERLKQNIVSLGAPQGLPAINALNPVSFYWKPSADRGEQQQYGLIAQQVRDIFPNLVQATNPTSLTPDGTLSINYEGLISPMILAIQELHATTTIRLTSLEDRIAALESGAISSTSGSSVLSTTSLASALESFGVLIQKGIAEFNTMVFRELVASTDAGGASSAGSVSIIAGNTVAQVANPLVKPSTKIFITFNARIAGTWWVSDKQAGGFRVSLSEAQAGDVSFDYFLVQTEGQLSAPAPESNVGTSYVPASGTDKVAPVLTLLGDNPLRLPVGTPFIDPGITAVDAVDGVISSIGIFVDGIAQESPSVIVDTGSATTHIITYSASDRMGNSATITRSVIVGESQAASVSEVQAPADTTPPVVTLVGDAAIEVATLAVFTDPGATALDETDGDITPSIVVSGAVDTAAAGLYTLTYTATDAAGNTASVSRVVTVVEAVPAS